ncbi:MAG: hypothetical protein R3F19_25760 [Verrucomicrobiales bacterium]
MSESGNNALARRPGWFLWLVAAFLTYHCAAMLHTLVPDWGLVERFRSDAASADQPLSSAELSAIAELDRKAAILPPVRPCDFAFVAYRILTGTRQDWQMFLAAPRDSNLEVVLEARDSNQQVHQLGAILPGFASTDNLADGRYYHFWARYELWNEMAYIQTYLENVGRLLKKSEDPYYKDVTLIYRKHIIQSPDEVARSGKISKVETREWWSPRDGWGD